MISFDPAAAVEITRRAATLALSLRGQFSAEIKADNTLVTDADRRVESFLCEELGKLTPGYSFLGEEGGLTGGDDVPCWVIDPIDGTTNYVRDIPLWSVSVGAVHQGEAIFGAIAAPQLNELFWAHKGGQAWRERAGQTVLLGTPDRGALIQEDLIACNTTVERLVDFSNVPCRLRNFGSLAYHLAVLAQGSLVAALAHEHKLYDIAAGMCICAEAGCEARYLNGQPWSGLPSEPTPSSPLLIAPPLTLAVLLEQLGRA